MRDAVRYFEVEGDGTSIPHGPLRVIAECVGEGNLDDPIGHRPGERHVTEAELLALDGGRQALKLWRAGDDSAHARAILDELAIDALDDELEGRG
jgi:hypothetical protein